ncbi:MAG: Flp pilus assembly protein CpaB, partial [Candidatus Sericytochromatia bacterium]|nr:Flp pilus assembly protein CpaB [Candidatus Tanganyikabacteria bacterium]
MADLRDKLRAREQGPASAGKSAKPRNAAVRKADPPIKAKTAAMSVLTDVNRRLLFAAAGIAGLAGLVAVMYLSDLAAGITGEGAKVPVWTVKKALPARHQLTEADLAVKQVPKALLAEGFLKEGDPAVGQITLAPMARGEVVLQVRVAKAGALTGIAPKLQPSERGFVYIPDGLQDVPLVKPEDTVDLIATLPEPGTERVISTPVLQKVRVLSVGDRFTNESTDSAPIGNAAITLAVPAAKVSLLSILKQAGNLHFALRAPGDTADSPTRISEADIERMVMGHVPRPAAPRAAAAPRSRPVVRT